MLLISSAVTPMHSPSRILIACDKFKGSLDAPSACAALARGLAARFPDAEIECFPIADGGEGFAASLATPLGGRWIEVPAHDALGRPILARYLLADGPLAVIEMAEASGMWRIRPDERDILRASTFGTGEMMRHAIEQCGATRLVIGLGGSATNDGGAGMAAALGIRFFDVHGCEPGPTPMDLSGRLARIDMSGRIPLPPITAACDVDSPLLGKQGATRVFGPQKGADVASIPMLENMLETVVRVSGGGQTAQCPGAGAAGGLGFGLMHFAGARLVPGFELFAALTGLEDRVAASDLVVTGEGSLDAQSLSGKGPVAIARLARDHGRRVIAFCGTTDAALRGSGLFDAITELAATRLPLDQLMSRAEELLETASAFPLPTSRGVP
jgi:glycerate kinase